MKGDSESMYNELYDLSASITYVSLDLSTATLCWMLQCISPHLTIDRKGFGEYLAQYKRWLYRIRFACTYHHEHWAWSYVPKLPNIPIINPGPDKLAPPPRDPVHAHKEFDFSWGTGPLDDPFSGMYHFNGTHPRVPGHEGVEAYNEKTKRVEWTSLTDIGQTNEYIHPIVYHRSLVHGWDAHSPLREGWTRSDWTGDDGKTRFWWHKGTDKKEALPEWAVLPDNSEEDFNFERRWYNECEKTRRTLDALSKVKDFQPGRDFLKTLDEKIEFGFDNKPQNQWP